MRQRIDIDTSTFVRFWLVVIGLVVAAFAIYSARTALIIVGASLFLALALNLPVTKLAKKLPGKSRVGATALAYVAVIALLGALVVLVIPPIIQQTAKFAQTVPQIVESASSQWDGLKGIIDEYDLQPQVDSAIASIRESTSSWASSVGQTVISSVGSFFGFLASVLLVLVLTFLMLIEGPEWMKRVWSLYRNKSKMEIHKKVVNRMHNVVTGYVTGQLTVSAIGATFAGLAVFVIGLIFPNVPLSLALPTAAITFTLSLIPMFGSTIGAVLIGILLALNNLPAAVTYVIYFVIYQQIENNFLSPHIQSRKINLSPLVILGSITIGLYMFGLAGAIIAIPIAGSIRILIEEYLEHNKKTRTKKEEIAA